MKDSNTNNSTFEIAANIRQVNNPFVFSEHEIRTAVDEHGEVWFCAKDVFEALLITWSGQRGSLKNYPEKWLMVLQLKTSQGVKDAVFLSEPAVYKTIFRSNKPEAEAFANWVCEEVLPTIRKQGWYGKISAAQETQLTYLMLKLMDQLSTKNSFIYKLILQRLRNVCNLLGEPMPDVALLGKDRQQFELEV